MRGVLFDHSTDTVLLWRNRQNDDKVGEEAAGDNFLGKLGGLMEFCRLKVS